MKIRKFNESNLETIEPKYFNFVVEEFIDNGAIIDYDIESGDMYWEIFIPEPKIHTNQNTISTDGYHVLAVWSEIEEYVESTKFLYNFSKMVKSCVDKIKDDFPNINVEIDSYLEKRGLLQSRVLHLMFKL